NVPSRETDDPKSAAPPSPSRLSGCNGSARYAQRPQPGPCAANSVSSSQPSAEATDSSAADGLLRGVVPVVQEAEPVGDAERVAERGHERGEGIGTHAHHVVGFQVNIRLLAGEHLVQVDGGEDFAVLADAADDLG